MDYDVIVVGGGAAGLSASIEAADLGARVLLVDAAERLGGATAVAGGVVYAAGTSTQRNRGITDSSDAMYNYYMALNQFKLEPALIRLFSDQSAAALEWLRAFGVEFPDENLYQSGTDGSFRGHRAKGFGAAIVQALEGALSQRNVDIATNTRVRKLVQGEDGRVSGILSEGNEVTANSVILATGGFGANVQMRAQLFANVADAGARAWYVGPKESRGDGIAMAQGVGAALTGLNRGLLLVTPGFARDFETYLPGWLLYVGRDGKRFVSETMSYSVFAAIVSGLPGRECFAVFDESSRAAAKGAPPSVGNPWSNPMWNADSLAQLTAKGLIRRADTLQELAEMCGIDPLALARTVTDYNDGVARGEDSVFFKKPEFLKSVSKPPYYAVSLRPEMICITGAGIRINARTEVVDQTGTVIQGLYAAGETVGGVYGDTYLGGGNAITSAVVFGRIAGKRAAASLQK